LLPAPPIEGLPQLRVGYIVRSWPRLSQTFIVQEILALERLGVEIEIFALSRADEPFVQSEVAQIRGPITWLEDEASRRAGDRLPPSVSDDAYSMALAYTESRPCWDEGYHVADRHGCLRLALALSEVLDHRARGGRPFCHLHAHFVHDPGAVAQLAGRLTGISWSATAHARDLYQVAPEVVAERVQAAAAVVTICQSNLRYLRSVAAPADHPKLRLIRNGLDLRAFDPPPAGYGAGPEGPLRIISVGRLVEKKGFDDLLRACQQLQASGLPFVCRLFGHGPLHDHLARSIEQLGLAGIVVLDGARTRGQLIAEMLASDVFALLPYVTPDGDRDGIPTVLMEAMACRLPVVTTRVAGIPDLVVDDVNGVLVPPRHSGAAASALAALAGDHRRRLRLGAEARRSVEVGFDGARSAELLAALFHGGRTR
jgi:glycosyltransferase involved in cell wall biosynthesis